MSLDVLVLGAHPEPAPAATMGAPRLAWAGACCEVLP